MPAADFYDAFGLPPGWKRGPNGKPVGPPGAEQWVSVVNGKRLVGYRRRRRDLHIEARLAARWKGKRRFFLADEIIVINADGTARPRSQVKTPAATARFLLPHGALVCRDGSREPEPGLFLVPPSERAGLRERLSAAALAFQAAARGHLRGSKQKVSISTGDASRVAGVTRAQVKRWIDAGRVETEGRGRARRIVLDVPSE